MANNITIYREAENILKKVGFSEGYAIPAQPDPERHKAVQMLITYNVVKKEGNRLIKGQAYFEVSQSGVKNYINSFNGDFAPSIFDRIWNLLTRNPIVIGIIIVMLSAWVTMRFMK